MREKRNLRFLADKGSVSLQHRGNFDVAYENQMKDIEEVRTPCVTVTHKLGTMAVYNNLSICRRLRQPEGTFQIGSAATPAGSWHHPSWESHFPLPNMA